MMNWLTLPGLTPYLQAEKLMEQTVENIIDKKISETALLLEHEDVYTAGTNAKESELILANQTDSKYIPVFKVGRGGKYTYHGPGQRVIYPMLDLSLPNRKKDIKLYIYNLESLIINVLKEIGVKSHRDQNNIGIWVNYGKSQAKIAAIGVRVKKWVTYHGIAVNISTDLDRYSGIIPCGITHFPVTSLFKLGIEISNLEFDYLVKTEFFKIFI